MGKLATATCIQVMVFFWVSALCNGYISDVSDEHTGSVLGVTEVVWMDVKFIQIYRQWFFHLIFQHPLKPVKSF